MKKVITLLLLVLLITGCSFIKIEDQSIDSIVDSVLIKDNKLYNNVLNGYKIYVPRGLKIINKNDNNSIISMKDTKLYMYVDIVSYYYKTEGNFVEDSSIYHSKKLNYNSIGYLNINKIEDKYFIEYMYNYAKIEAYVEEKDLKTSIMNMSYILSSVKYNDEVINTLIDENVLNYKEEKYDIFTSKKNQDGFLEYIEKYDNYEGYKNKIKDNDIIDFDTDE